MRSDSKQAGRIRAAAKAEDRWVDCTFSRALSTILVLDDGHVVGCAFSPQSILRRLKNAAEADPTLGDAEDENIADNGGTNDEQN